MRGAGAGEPARLPVRQMEQPVVPRVGENLAGHVARVLCMPEEDGG